MLSDQSLLKKSLACKCPRCGEGDLFAPGLTLNVRETCPHCQFNLGDHDIGDAPAFFLIFILGFLIVPLAWGLELLVAPPLWVHAVLWTVVALGITLGTLRPLKSCMITLQFKHRPEDWE